MKRQRKVYELIPIFKREREGDKESESERRNREWLQISNTGNPLPLHTYLFCTPSPQVHAQRKRHGATAGM